MGGAERAKGISAKGKGVDASLGAIKVSIQPIIWGISDKNQYIGSMRYCMWELWVYRYHTRNCAILQYAERVEASNVYCWQRTGCDRRRNRCTQQSIDR